MVKVEIKKVKLSEIHLNPDNPRTIKKQAMDRLVKSLHEFPEMMELREIIVDETMTVLGGNMRTLALRQAGEQEALAKICTGLTAEQKREFVIKDNAEFGEWNMDVLANRWDDLPLVEWGVDIPSGWTESKNNKEEIKEDIDEIRNGLHNGIMVIIGWYQILVPKDHPFFEKFWELMGTNKNWDNEEKEKILEKIYDAL